MSPRGRRSCDQSGGPSSSRRDCKRSSRPSRPQYAHPESTLAAGASCARRHWCRTARGAGVANPARNEVPATVLATTAIRRSYVGIADSGRQRGRTLLRRFDGFQRRHGIIDFTYAVVRKYLDDERAKLAALITYSGFPSVFPLLLLAATILTEIYTAHPSLQQRLTEELVAPRLRTDVKRALEQLPPT